MLLRSTLIYAPAIVLPRLAAIVLLIVVTRLLDRPEYGLLTLVVTVGEMADVTVSNWLRISLIRLGGVEKVATGTIMRGARALLATTVLSVAVALVAAVAIVPERWQEFALATALYVSAGNLSRFGLTFLQIQRRRVLYTLLEAVRALLVVVLPILALLFVSRSFVVASVVASLATAAVGAVGVVFAFRSAGAGLASFSYRELTALGTPLVVLAILSLTMGSVDRVLIKLFIDAGAVGVFAAAYALARQPVDILSNAVNQGGYPELVKRFDTEGEAVAGRFIGAQLGFSAQLLFPAAALLVAISRDLVALVLPSDYHAEAQAVFPIITAGVLCLNFKTFVFDNIFNVYKRNWLQVASLVPGAVLAVVLGLLLIPPFGLSGAAWAFLLAAAVSLLASMIISRRLIRLEIPYRDLSMAGVVTVAATATALLVQQAALAEPLLVRLAATSVAGGTAFLILTAALHWADARAFIASLGRSS